MNKYVLGLDIADDHIAGALVSQGRTGEKTLVSLMHGPVHAEGELIDLSDVFVEAEGGELTTMAGLPLSSLSLRNLFLPFIDKNKIGQTLPFELEEQLITPIDHLRFEYSVNEESEDGSKILVAGLRKDLLNDYVRSLESQNLMPAGICPAVLTLAERMVEKSDLYGEGTIIIDTSVSSADLVLVRDNNVVFMRRIVYPDSMSAEQILAMVDNEGLIDNRDAALAFITELCRLIERNIYFFQRNNDTAIDFDKVVLTGVMAMDDFFGSAMEQQLDMKVRKFEMFAVSGLAASDTTSRAYRPSLHDRALALALQGFQKSSTMNFYQDNASALLRFIRNKKQMGLSLGVSGVAFLLFMVFLGLTHNRLQESYDKLDHELETIYLETFPTGTLRTEPYLQMQSKLKELRDPADGVPLFPTDKRMLNILADISTRTPKNIKVEVDRLIIDRDSVRIKGNTGTFNDVNAMKSQIEESALYESVDILSATADTKKKNIRFELKLQLIGEN